jgi:hypothetical protein
MAVKTVRVVSGADEVRAYCRENYVERARSAGQSKFSICAGDVRDALGWKSRMPSICSAIGASKFVDDNGIIRIGLDGPTNGSTTTFHFQFR